MTAAVIEHHFTCPYCWESISFLLDLSVSGQRYVEDCEVCCNPIEIFYECVDSQISQFRAIRLD